MKIIDRRKKYFLLVDVETTGTIYFPLIYDIGIKVVTKKGEVMERLHFLIDEIFDNKKLMSSAYYAEKIPIYKDMLKNKGITKKPYDYVLYVIQNLLDMYNIDTIPAYNVNFDMRALSATTQYLLHIKRDGMKDIDFLSKLFNRPLKKLCILRLACETIMSQKTYIKQAIRHNWINEKGHIYTKAEHCYRYISNNPNFIESHTALADCDIETEIFAQCFKQHKKFSNKTGSGWRIIHNEYLKLVAT